MFSGPELDHVYTRYTAELHQWLPTYLEATGTAGRVRFKRLCEFFDLDSSGSRVVLDAVQRFSNASKDDCANSFVDNSESNRVRSLSEPAARWEAVKHALFKSLPSEVRFDAEGQLANMNHDSTESLLAFVMRYRRSAEEFMKTHMISDHRAMQILYRKLPFELQQVLVLMDFSTTTLAKVEWGIRNRMKWMGGQHIMSGQ